MFNKLSQANSSLIAQDCFHCTLAAYGVLNQHGSFFLSHWISRYEGYTDLHFFFFEKWRP